MDRYELLIGAQYIVASAIDLGKNIDDLFSGDSPTLPPDIKQVAIGLAINGLFGVPYKGEA